MPHRPRRPDPPRNPGFLPGLPLLLAGLGLGLALAHDRDGGGSIPPPDQPTLGSGVSCPRVVPAASPEAAAQGLPCLGPDHPVDDRRGQRRLASELGSLEESGQAVSGKALAAQFKRTRARLDLPGPAKEDTLSPAEIYQRRQSGVLVFASIYKCDRCSEWHTRPAGGWVLSADGAVVTNYHVVDHPEAPAFGVMTSGGEVYLVTEVLAVSKADDVAIVKVDAPPGALAPIPLAREPVRVGEPATVISNPDGRLFTLTHGVVSRYYLHNRKGHGRVRRLAITADFARGSSGSAVFDGRGVVCGMVTSTDSIYYDKEKGVQQNLQMVIKSCVPADSILGLIEAPGAD